MDGGNTENDTDRTILEGGTDRNILLYYLYKATKAVEFYRPVMYLFFLAQGLSFVQITVLEAIYNLTTVFGEIPTGYVGDRVGRRNSLLIGTALIAVTLAAMGLVDVIDDQTRSFLALCGLYVLWSSGYNFRSGSEDAWLYDTLSDTLSEDAFAHVRGRGEAVSLAVGVVGAVVGGYLGGLNLAYPFYVAAVVTGLGVVVLLAIEESDTYEASESDQLGIRESVGLIRQTLLQKNIRAFVLYYYVLFASVTYLAFIFLQPIFEGVVTDLGVSQSRVEPLLGWFYAGYSLLGAALSYKAGFIKDRLGVRHWFVALPFVLGLAFVGMWVVPVLALPVLLVTRGIADTTRSLASQYVNDRIESVGRATILSAMAMVSGLSVVFFQLTSGVIADGIEEVIGSPKPATGPLFALAAAGAVLVVGSALILLWERPVQPTETS